MIRYWFNPYFTNGSFAFWFIRPIEYSLWMYWVSGMGSNLTSGVGNPRLTKLQASMFAFPPYIKGVVIGLILSDAWLIFSTKASKNARLGFKQSLDRFPYFWNVFSILSHYCSALPHLTSNVRKGVECFGVQLQTRALPCFTELHNQFYVNGVKVLPAIIFELLTPVALAHWICGDGSVQRHGLILCTYSFFFLTGEPPNNKWIRRATLSLIHFCAPCPKNQRLRG